MSKFLPADHYRDWFTSKQLLVKPAMLDLSQPAEIKFGSGDNETKFTVDFQSKDHEMYVMSNQGRHWAVRGVLKTSLGLQVTLYGPVLDKKPENVMMSGDQFSVKWTDIDFVELKEDGSSVGAGGCLVKVDPTLPLVSNVMDTVRANVNVLMDPLAYEGRTVMIRDWSPSSNSQ